MKQTYTETVIRLDEKVKNIKENLENFIKENTETHKEILFKITELSNHVNEENEKTNKRMDKLEHKNIEIKAYWRLIVIISGGTGGLFTLIITILKTINMI